MSRRKKEESKDDRPFVFRRATPGDEWPALSAVQEEKFGPPGKLFPMLGQLVAVPSPSGNGWIEASLDQVFSDVRVTPMSSDSRKYARMHRYPLDDVRPIKGRKY